MMAMSEYINAFSSATSFSSILFGEELNPPVAMNPERVPHGQTVINAIVADFADGVIRSTLDLPGNCFRFVRDASYVLFENGIDHVVTIGNVTVNGLAHFTCTPESVAIEFEKGFQPELVANAHAWLTLDTG
jgi:hypothetical protein